MLLNADIAGDAEAMILSQSNILAFERGAYPVAETGALHYGSSSTEIGRHHFQWVFVPPFSSR